MVKHIYPKSSLVLELPYHRPYSKLCPFCNSINTRDDVFVEISVSFHSNAKSVMPELCDFQIHVNGQQTFFINEKIVSIFSGRLKKMALVDQEKPGKTGIKILEVDDFPGGPDGFELIARFCYSNGDGITITVSNLSVLHCCSVYLDMTLKVSRTNNLLERTRTFLEGMFYWSWNDVLVCLKSCDSFSDYADSIGLLQKLICSLLAKIAQNSSDFNSPASTSSSPDTTSGFRLFPSTKTTPETIGKPRTSFSNSNSKQAWWFDDLTILPPKIIEKVIKTLGSYGNDNNSLILTRFLIHYLKAAVRSKRRYSKSEYSGLADTAVYGVILLGESAFSCRGLFWVLRVVVSGFGLSKDSRSQLETLIGGMLDKATLDDLLVSSGHDGCVYDVNLVLRLTRMFVNGGGDYNVVDHTTVQKMKKVGRLIDKYLKEISPDHNLKLSKFLGISESLPDLARDSFDGVYRAIDIYLEAHPSLSVKEQSRLCRSLNYEKLSLEACKDLAKNPRIPPRIAIQALMSQQSKVPQTEKFVVNKCSDGHLVTSLKDSELKAGNDGGEDEDMNLSDEAGTEHMRLHLERMQWRVIELEKVCKNMKGQMSKMVKNTPANNRGLPRLC